MRIDGRELGAVFVGGCAGALARAGVVEALPAHPGHWPWATFLVNLVGTFVLGWVATVGPGRVPAPSIRRALLGAGFCGAFTTFSAIQLELLTFLDDGDVALAAGYAAGSVAAGLAAVLLAATLVRRGRLPA